MLTLPPWVIAVLAVAPLVPFLNAAVGLDEPVFLAVARQILVDPSDPFGFEMVWDPISSHVAVFNHNPPLLSYYLAPWIGWFGEREWWLHVLMLPFPFLAARSFATLARRWCGDALLPTLWLAWCPAFAVLATTLLLDIPALALQLAAVAAILRAMDAPSGRRARWGWIAGIATAGAGLTKYVALSTLPLLLLAILCWPVSSPAPVLRERAGLLVRVVMPGLVAWGAWAIHTRDLYGAVHFGGGLALVSARSLQPDAFWNHLASAPIYYGLALLFPVGLAMSRLLRGRSGAELAALGLVAGAAIAQFVLPEGEPHRRAEAGWQTALWAAAGVGGFALVWGRLTWPAHWRPRRVDVFCVGWLAGHALFTIAFNWHVTAADALFSGPPLLLLVFRDGLLRPGVAAGCGGALALLAASVLLTSADVTQRGVYRELASRLSREIGEQGGARWFVGQWGFQYYLEREGFQALPPAQHAIRKGPPDLVPGDWLATARNVSQLDSSWILDRHRFRRAGRWERTAPLPVHTMNPDAGAGFYTHRLGYQPFALGWGLLERVQLARVQGPRRPGRGRTAPKALDIPGPGV